MSSSKSKETVDGTVTRFNCCALSFSLILAALEGAFSYRESALQQIPLLLMYVVWLGFIIAFLLRLLLQSARLRYYSGAFLVWLVVAPFVGAHAGVMIRDAVFRSRLAAYVAAVDAVSVGGDAAAVPKLAYRVTVGKTPSGTPEVFFFWGGGFPVKHTAFVYRTEQPWNDAKFKKAWPYIRSVAPDWYVVSD